MHARGQARGHVLLDDDASGSTVSVNPSTLMTRIGVPRSSERPSAVFALHSSPPAMTEPIGLSGDRTSPIAPAAIWAPLATSSPTPRDRIAPYTIKATNVAAVALMTAITDGATRTNGSNGSAGPVK